MECFVRRKWQRSGHELQQPATSHALDFEQLSATASTRWQGADDPTCLVFSCRLPRMPTARFTGFGPIDRLLRLRVDDTFACLRGGRQGLVWQVAHLVVLLGKQTRYSRFSLSSRSGTTPRVRGWVAPSLSWSSWFWSAQPTADWHAPDPLLEPWTCAHDLYPRWCRRRHQRFPCRELPRRQPAALRRFPQQGYSCARLHVHTDPGPVLFQVSLVGLWGRGGARQVSQGTWHVMLLVHSRQRPPTTSAPSGGPSALRWFYSSSISAWSSARSLAFLRKLR